MAKHFTESEREELARLHWREYTSDEIARRMGRHRSTIYRELKRNSTNGVYFPCQAQRQAERRRRERPLARKADRPSVNGTVRRLLSRYCSPDEIARRMKLERPDRPRDCVCASTVYRWIDRQEEERDYWKSYLRRRGRRPCRGPQNPEDSARKARLDGRPKVIERRGRIGDFEGDLVLGKQGTGGLKTLVDRKSRYLLLMKVARKEAPYVYRKTRARLKTLPTTKRRSVTYDNGGEFAKCPLLEKSLGIKVYWAEPGRPYQRDTNENTNGLVRQFFPKGTDFSTVTPWEAREAEKLLNERPRKRLGYKTPREFLAEQCPRAFET
jgi:IS30 family transposase